MLFQVTSGRLCQKVESTTHDAAIRFAFAKWDGKFPLGVVTECFSVGKEDTRWVDTGTILDSMNIGFRVDEHQVHFTVV